MEATGSIFEDAEVISSYSRAQAIEDGVLVDLNAVVPEVTAQHFKVPVACTASVFAIVKRAVDNQRYYNDYNGVFHDLFHMARVVGRSVDPSTREFQVIVRGAGRRSVYELRLVVGPGDDGEPVVTLMTSTED